MMMMTVLVPVLKPMMMTTMLVLVQVLKPMSHDQQQQRSRQCARARRLHRQYNSQGAWRRGSDMAR